MYKTLGFVVAMAICALIVSPPLFGQVAGSHFAAGVVDESGAIRVPENFRRDYVMLGAWSVRSDPDNSDAGLHIVYAPRRAVDAYRRSGTFPDGTVLVKELFAGVTEELTTGTATHAAERAGYFVMVRDDAGRFNGNPLWGDGWGWAFFDADDPETTTTSDYVAECLVCHEPARDTDLVYIQAYPVLTGD